LQGGLYELTRLALDLFEPLNDSGKVIRFPFMQSVVCRFADAVKRRSARSFLLFSWQKPRQGGRSGAEPTVAVTSRAMIVYRLNRAADSKTSGCPAT
jgi:hypothetical protein